MRRNIAFTPMAVRMRPSPPTYRRPRKPTELYPSFRGRRNSLADLGAPSRTTKASITTAGAANTGLFDRGLRAVAKVHLTFTRQAIYSGIGFHKATTRAQWVDPKYAGFRQNAGRQPQLRSPMFEHRGAIGISISQNTVSVRLCHANSVLSRALFHHQAMVPAWRARGGHLRENGRAGKSMRGQAPHSLPPQDAIR